MRKSISAVVAVAAFATLAAPASTAVTRTVKVGDNYFVRDGGAPTVSVKRNTRVKWLWVGDKPHNVKVRRGPVRFSSRTMTSGSYSKAMTRTGTYKIYCSVHGASEQAMTLKVVR